MTCDVLLLWLISCVIFSCFFFFGSVNTQLLPLASCTCFFHTQLGLTSISLNTLHTFTKDHSIWLYLPHVCKFRSKILFLMGLSENQLPLFMWLLWLLFLVCRKKNAGSELFQVFPKPFPSIYDTFYGCTMKRTDWIKSDELLETWITRSIKKEKPCRMWPTTYFWQRYCCIHPLVSFFLVFSFQTTFCILAGVWLLGETNVRTTSSTPSKSLNITEAYQWGIPQDSSHHLSPATSWFTLVIPAVHRGLWCETFCASLGSLSTNWRLNVETGL